MSPTEPLHEHRKVTASSERSFGIVFAAVFGIIGLWPVMARFEAPRYWAFALGALFLAGAFLAPAVLRPFNRLWVKLGDLLHQVMNPIIMGFIYYVAVVPVGLLLRLLGKDILRLKRDPSVDSYWIIREPPGPVAGSMSKQF